MDKREEYLLSQGIRAEMIAAVNAFRATYDVDSAVAERIACPSMPFFGKETLEMAIAAILQESNLLLSGGKATGKNVLCETLSWIFGRPAFDISFHVNTDSASLIGTDTFRNNEVQLRKGPVYSCAEFGGFGILDEINMAKNDAVSVLHATLDHRRRIDVPGYSRIHLHPATRFIGTMNQGYQIRVNSIVPGLTDSEMIHPVGMDAMFQQHIAPNAAHIPLGRLGTTGDMAAGILYLASDAASWVTGHCLVIDGGELCG